MRICLRAQILQSVFSLFELQSVFGSLLSLSVRIFVASPAFKSAVALNISKLRFTALPWGMNVPRSLQIPSTELCSDKIAQGSHLWECGIWLQLMEQRSLSVEKLTSVVFSAACHPGCGKCHYLVCTSMMCFEKLKSIFTVK